ncbi:MAG TPA: EAL domain-containing protein [Gammaproteobacteria bacterium]
MPDVSRLHVLHIEDNSIDALAFKRVLGHIYHYDFHLTHVSSLESAVYEAAQTTFDIAFLDLSLPDASGLESVRSLRQIAPELPIVILSGSKDPEITLQAVECGAQDYLVKGQIDESLILRTIRYALDRKRMELKLAHLSQYDSLTGLANRGLFYDRLRQAMLRAERRKHTIALLFVDLDFFKSINDDHGHHIGDLLLKEVAERLKANVRREDTVARMGGDEFTVILEQIQDQAAISVIAEKLLQSLSCPYEVNGHKLSITASIGIMPYDGRPGMTPEDLLRNSDTAMYKAKNSGRNHYYFVPEQARMFAPAFGKLREELPLALDRNEFFLVYQPQVDVKHRIFVGAEALLRWRHPALGLVDPSSFIPLLEESNKIHAVGEWVLRTAGRQWSAWQREGVVPESALLFINLFSRQIREGDITARVKAQLHKSGLNPAQIVFEVAESALLRRDESSRQTLRDLKAFGVGLAVDGFGTGFSALHYLKSFPLDCVKLDLSGISDLVENPTEKIITSSIVHLAQELNLQIIVEGVDTLEKVKLLQSYGCRLFQGNYFSPPLTVGSFPSECRRVALK